ncbi:TIGR02679 family protein [Nonomuraea sp. NEAU-A123]|uniref:TIGR02679 family protein n=1 Tax=Nonomuraea sp. NEAU-A123 TaxID=2839649 RepID=UPI001BE3E7B5|nr:TIGR02679 family protein [Nonomuraea sp. NEAU-A123]MBT2228195.1 TIGR02679 family protein [Nonomuraea sp. NEAU-A123]
MTGADTTGKDRLRRLLGGEETAWLVERARQRLERGRPLTGTVTLSTATAAQRRVAELLLGRRAGAGTSLSVSLEEVDRVLRTSGAAPDGLQEAVVRLRGPLRDLAGEREASASAWREAFENLDAATATRPELAGWRAWLESTGLVRRLAPDPGQARHLLDQLARVVARLPSPGLPIGRLAAQTSGDAHALDEGRPLGTLALSAAKALTGRAYPGEAGADARRAAWAAVGVHLDDLSSLVLCLGLPGDDRTPTGRMLAAARAAGEPCVLTLRQLRRHDGPLSSAGLVRICENPVVVAAAADELGPSCPPLVCGGGRPSAAVWQLLDLLSEGGGRFAYHGDFDWGGVAIAAAIHDRYGFEPWRFDTAAYEAALSPAGPSSAEPSTAAASPAAVSQAALTGRPCPTPWDPNLAEVMERRAVRVEEELVLPVLLSDLSPSPRDRGTW